MAAFGRSGRRRRRRRRLATAGLPAPATGWERGEGGRSAGRGLALVLGCYFDAPRTCLLLSSRLSTGGDAGRTNAAGRLSSNSCVAETIAVVSYSLLLMLVQVCKGKRDKLVIFYIVVQLICAHVGRTISITTTITLPNCPFCPAVLSLCVLPLFRNVFANLYTLTKWCGF